ncbi:MAG TPA: hypothetical protein VND66_04830 [Acidobacteriaceae bacterium]|nr:hypothetical protein [Acidobacteriaceae bacterium]
MGLRWFLVLSGLILSPAAFTLRAQTPSAGTGTGAPVASHGTTSSDTKSSPSSSGKSANRKALSGVHHTAHHAPRAKTNAPVATPAPAPLPVPPADQPPTPATVEFHQGMLSIQARNSSLVHTLSLVSRETGLIVEGLGSDQRIYGQYGPGTLASTLTALLDGSGYNFVIIGGEGGQSPKLVLTAGNAAAATNTAAAAGSAPIASAPSDESAPADPSKPVQPKTPQEIFNELRKMHPQ